MSKIDDKNSVSKLGYQLYMQLILFGIAMVSFVIILGFFLYMAIQEYDWKLVAVVGGADSLFGLVILQITRSLFKSK
tara:strand:- start:211 stop:441 length:231 start_codon:yes stop_codon:yes gene_type:complete